MMSRTACTQDLQLLSERGGKRNLGKRRELQVEKGEREGENEGREEVG